MGVEFRASERMSLGVEWELAIVDAESRDLVPRAAEVIAATALPDGRPDPRIHRELQRNTVELVTGVCHDVPEAMADLDGALSAVRAVTDRLGCELFSAGTHPFADSLRQEVNESPRYDTLIDRTQWWGRQMLIYGVHVHVGITSVHHVMPVLNSMLRYVPHLQALSASSPFWAGEDTGYASNRALMFQQLPTAGLPFQFDDWAGYEGYVADMLTTGVVDDISEIRWDLRPSPRLGTLEVRVCDGIPSRAELASVVALAHCLVVDLVERLEAGEDLPTMPPWHVQENKWRAARYGLDAEIILDAAGTERPVTDDLSDLQDRLQPVARRLGCAPALEGLDAILVNGSSYQRQRSAAAGSGLVAVVDQLVRELRQGVDA